MKTFTLLAALLFAPVAFADDAPKAGETTTTKTSGAHTYAKPAKAAKLTKSELQVVAHYRELNQMEIRLGKAAVKNGKSPDVKSYGQMMIKDHGASNKKLAALAKKRGQKIPVERPVTDIMKQEKAEAKTTAMKLEKMTGTEFDAAYLSAMISDHEKELARADSMIAQVQDSELADLIRAEKPVFEQHADRARELKRNLGAPTTSSLSPSEPADTKSATLKMR